MLQRFVYKCGTEELRIPKYDLLLHGFYELIFSSKPLL